MTTISLTEAESATPAADASKQATINTPSTDEPTTKTKKIPEPSKEEASPKSQKQDSSKSNDTKPAPTESTPKSTPKSPSKSPSKSTPKSTAEDTKEPTKLETKKTETKKIETKKTETKKTENTETEKKETKSSVTKLPSMMPQKRSSTRRPAKEERSPPRTSEVNGEESKVVNSEKADKAKEEEEKEKEWAKDRAKDRAERRSRRDSEKEAEEQLESCIKDKVYGRDYLLQFQSLYTDKPPNLPDMEAIIGSESNKAQANKQNTPCGGGGGGAPGQWGHNNKRGGNNRNDRGDNQRGGNNRDNRKGGGGNKGGRRGPKRDQPMDIEVKALEKTENAYTIKRDVAEDEKTIRSLRGILNKLTPEKFDVLVEKVKELTIDTEDLLKAAVDAVFEKALAEPNFSPVYAEFCKEINTVLPTFKSEDKTANTFKRLILNQCQAEFERENNQDPAEVAKMSKEERTAHGKFLKKRMLGTIRLIGELYKRKMLSSTIMTSCVFILFGDVKNPQDENVEALCKLLATVGKMLEQDKSYNKISMNNLMQQLQVVAAHPTLSSRLRFMIQDVQDLWKANWKSRTKETGAKKISEIRKEDSEAKKRKEVEDKDRERKNRRHDRDHRDRHDSHGFGGAKLKVHHDRYASQSSNRAPNNRTPTKQNQGEWATQSNRKQGKWQKGAKRDNSSTPRSGNNTPTNKNTNPPPRNNSRGTPKTSKEDKPKPKPSFVNAFSMLSDTEDEDEGDEGDEGDADEEAEEEAKISLTYDEARPKIRSLLSEYFSAMDKAEVKLCIEELGTTEFHGEIVFTALDLAIDGKVTMREALPGLLLFLAKEKILTENHFILGCRNYLAVVEDLLCDIPFALNHMGQIMAPVVLAGVMELSFFAGSDTDSLKSGGQLAKFMEAMFKEVLKQKDAETLLSLVKESGIRLENVVKKGVTVSKWIDEKGLLDGLKEFEF